MIIWNERRDKMNKTEAKLSKIRLMSKLFKGFADYSRLLIFYSLLGCEKTVSELVEESGISQSGISNHLKCLRECDLLIDRQDGKFVYYSIKDERAKEIILLAEKMLADISEEKYQCMRY